MKRMPMTYKRTEDLNADLWYTWPLGILTKSGVVERTERGNILDVDHSKIMGSQSLGFTKMGQKCVHER